MIKLYIDTNIIIYNIEDNKNLMEKILVIHLLNYFSKQFLANII